MRAALAIIFVILMLPRFATAIEHCADKLDSGYELRDFLSADPTVNPIAKYPAVLVPTPLLYGMVGLQKSYDRRTLQPSPETPKISTLTFSWKNVSTIAPEINSDTYYTLFNPPVALLPGTMQHELVLKWKQRLVEQYGDFNYERIENYVRRKAMEPTPGNAWLRTKLLSNFFGDGPLTADQIATALNDYIVIKVIEPVGKSAPFFITINPPDPGSIRVKTAEEIERIRATLDVSVERHFATEINRRGLNISFNDAIAMHLRNKPTKANQWLDRLQKEIMDDLKLLSHHGVDLSIKDHRGRKFLLIKIPVLGREIEWPLDS